MGTRNTEQIRGFEVGRGNLPASPKVVAENTNSRASLMMRRFGLGLAAIGALSAASCDPDARMKDMSLSPLEAPDHSESLVCEAVNVNSNGSELSLVATFIYENGQRLEAGKSVPLSLQFLDKNGDELKVVEILGQVGFDGDMRVSYQFDQGEKLVTDSINVVSSDQEIATWKKPNVEDQRLEFSSWD